jgi:hypothetical protein
MNIQSSIEFTENKEIISLYIDTTKSFLNLSTGALSLTIVFREKIIGLATCGHVSKWMVASWFCYLLAIGFGALYQYCGVKFLDSSSRSPGAKGIFGFFEKNPGWLYGLMLVCFFLGSLLLVVAAGLAIP